MMIASMGGNGGNIGGPKTPICQGQSPPSLLERQQQQQQQLQQQQYQIMETQNQPMEDDGNCQDGNGAAGRMKTCRVCGDSATGYNFNVISCESCKAFFRRNALRPKEFKCPYSNDCEINAVSRRFCQKCRLRKCFMVGMKKEWILSEDQLRRRKNARIKNQMGKDGNQQPNTPSSVGEGSMPGSVAPVTPYVGNGNGGLNPFSPPQQQFFHHTQQQQQTPPPPQSSINAVAAMAAASILHNQTQGQSHSPLNSPLLAAAAAITKLAGSPKNSPTGASSVLSSGLDSSPLATFGLGNSPDYGGKQNLFACGGVSLDNKASPSTGTHSPPSILPQLQNPHPIDVEQRYDPQVLRLAQQQLLKKAQLQQAAAVLRKSSDGLISLASAAAAQQQQLQQNQQSPVAAVSPFVEQCQRLMLLGQQQQGIVSPQIVKNGDIGNGHSASILARLYGNNNVTNTNISSNLSGFNSNTNSSAIPKPLLEAAAAAVAAAKNASNNVNNNQVSNNGSSLTAANNGTSNNNEVKTLMEMDANTRERLMSMRINKTIRDELGISNSPPDGNNLQQSLSPNPIRIEERSSPLSRSNSISGNSSLVYTDLRNYQLNSKEQNDLNYVKTAFSSMDEELKNEFLKNSKLLGIMTKEQPQSPDDMMCLLDMMMRRLVKMAKKLPSFAEFSNSGKFSLLKAAMIDLLTLRGASRLDSENRCWKSPLLNRDIRCRIDIFDRLNDDMQKSRVMDFYKKLHPKLKSDQVANNLIIVVVLFSHYADTDLSAEDRTLADKHYHNHKQLLRRYVESAYGPDEAKVIYETLDEAFSLLKDVTKKVPDLFPPDKINKKQAEGSLFQEFFRIKTKEDSKIKLEPTETTSTEQKEVKEKEEEEGDNGECKAKKIKIEENLKEEEGKKGRRRK
uniref:Uncharacterized protein n=1 Tax=Meloidogyne incognita TaxID=6306 RepID=A0A914MG88_MELIC